MCETGGQSDRVACGAIFARGRRRYLHLVAFSPDGTRLVTVSRDQMVRIWDVAGGRELAALKHPSMLAFAAFSPDGSRLITFRRRKMRASEMLQTAASPPCSSIL